MGLLDGKYLLAIIIPFIEWLALSSFVAFYESVNGWQRGVYIGAWSAWIMAESLCIF
jgi:hypothetical protein